MSASARTYPVVEDQYSKDDRLRPLKCFKNEARRNTVSYSRLDDGLWSQVARETPNGSHQSRIAIVPPLKALRAGLYSPRFQLAYHLVP